MVICAIDNAVIPSSATGGFAPPKPLSQGDVKDWIKISCITLVNYSLAAAALPDVIESIVLWLPSANGKTVKWYGNDLWVFVGSNTKVSIHTKFQ